MALGHVKELAKLAFFHMRELPPLAHMAPQHGQPEKHPAEQVVRPRLYLLECMSTELISDIEPSREIGARATIAQS